MSIENIKDTHVFFPHDLAASSKGKGCFQTIRNRPWCLRNLNLSHSAQLCGQELNEPYLFECSKRQRIEATTTK